MHQKYDLLVDKGFSQMELKRKMIYLPKVHPAHQNVEFGCMDALAPASRPEGMARCFGAPGAPKC